MKKRRNDGTKEGRANRGQTKRIEGLRGQSSEALKAGSDYGTEERTPVTEEDAGEGVDK